MEIRNLPSVQETEYRARSKSDSHALNENENQIFNDIMNLFNKANTLDKKIYELNLFSGIESRCYAQRLEESLKGMKQLQEKYDNLFVPKDGMKTLTAYAMDADVNASDITAADKCSETNDITAAVVSSVSKTRLYDETYDETLVPPSLKLYIGPDSFHKDSHILVIEDSDISDALDGNVNSIWFRRILTDTTVESIENELVIGLPEDIVTSRLVNQIIIYPFPSGWTDIMDVEYKTNGEWKTVEGFECHEGYSEEEYRDIFGNRLYRGVLKDAPNIRLCFNAVQTNQVKIKLRQRHFTYDASNSRREWYIGLRDVNILYNRYSRERSEFDMVFEFPEAEGFIKVYDTEVICNNSPDPEIMRNIFKDYYYYDDEGITHKIPDSLPFILDGKKMKVRITIDGTSETPDISRCTVKYRTV